MTFLFSVFFGYLRGDTPILKASFAVGVRVRPEGKGGLFDDNLPPILSSRPVLLSHLIQSRQITRAYHQSEILPPPLPGAGTALVRTGKEEMERDEREGILSGRAAGKSFAEGRSFNGNGRSVLRRGGLRGWSSSVDGALYIYLGGHCTCSAPPLPPPTDLMDARLVLVDDQTRRAILCDSNSKLSSNNMCPWICTVMIRIYCAKSSPRLPELSSRKRTILTVSI